MKTTQDILDFYGVEIGKRYIVKNKTSWFACNTIFDIQENDYYIGSVAVVARGDSFPLMVLAACDYEEYKLILDDVERDYLQKYVMNNPAFKGKVETIQKYAEDDNERGFLSINLFKDYAGLPYFPLDTMYKGMKVGKKYTPKELGLEE